MRVTSSRSSTNRRMNSTWRSISLIGYCSAASFGAAMRMSCSALTSGASGLHILRSEKRMATPTHQILTGISENARCRGVAPHDRAVAVEQQDGVLRRLLGVQAQERLD